MKYPEGVRWVPLLESYLRPVIECCPSLAETRGFSWAISGRKAETAQLTEKLGAAVVIYRSCQFEIKTKDKL